jgi:hypothetical protein
MHAEINVRFELSIDTTKSVPLATLAEILTEQNVESTLLEAIVESLDAACVEAICGEKHAHGNGDKRFQRAGTDTRQAVTTAGDHEFTFHNIEDTAAGKTERSYFRPVEDVIDFDGQRQYQQDIAAKSIDLATDLSYRDAADHGDGFETMPSPDTINRRVKEYGSKLTEFVAEHRRGTEAETVVPDGTKCPSQDDDRSFHEVQVTLGEDADENSHSLLDLSVNADWDEIASELDNGDAVTDDAEVVSDAEQRLVTAFSDDAHEHQLDLVHVPRTLSYKLWEDGALSLEDREEIISEVAGDLFHLKNSVEKHRPEGNRSAIRKRIARTEQRLEKTAWQLDQLSSPKAAQYLRSGLASMMTFAEEAVEGFEVPWTSNPVERAMGEVASRCKSQWMRWTEQGLETLLQLKLVKYANPDHYRSLFDGLITRSAKTAIDCELTVEALGGEL